MDVLRTAVSPDGAATDRAASMEALVTELRQRLSVAADGGSASARSTHRARGKLLARDRIDRLLDPGTPFLRSRRWPQRGCTTGPPRAPGWSPGSG